MRIKKTSEITATQGTIIDSLDGSSTTDAPSINAVNEALNNKTDISSLITANTGTISQNNSYKVGNIIVINLFITNCSLSTSVSNIITLDSSIRPNKQEFPYVFLPHNLSKLDNSYLAEDGIVKVTANASVTTGMQILLVYVL